MRNLTSRLKRLGPDGLLALFLSNLVIFCCLGLTVAPLLSRVYRTAKHTPSSAASNRLMVVLGTRLDEDRITSLFKLRLDRALDICQRQKMTGVLILGGITTGNRCSEAEKGETYLTCHGIDARQILTEDRSLNTLENLKHARPIISAYTETPVVITNRFHLARCSTLAQGMGVTLDLCAAEEELCLSFITMLRIFLEAYYLHWYEVGKRWSHWTRNEKSLERIS